MSLCPSVHREESLSLSATFPSRDGDPEQRGHGLCHRPSELRCESRTVGIPLRHQVPPRSTTMPRVPSRSPCPLPTGRRRRPGRRQPYLRVHHGRRDRRSSCRRAPGDRAVPPCPARPRCTPSPGAYQASWLDNRPFDRRASPLPPEHVPRSIAGRATSGLRQVILRVPPPGDEGDGARVVRGHTRQPVASSGAHTQYPPTSATMTTTSRCRAGRGGRSWRRHDGRGQPTCAWTWPRGCLPASAQLPSSRSAHRHYLHRSPPPAGSTRWQQGQRGIMGCFARRYLHTSAASARPADPSGELPAIGRRPSACRGAQACPLAQGAWKGGDRPGGRHVESSPTGEVTSTCRRRRPRTGQAQDPEGYQRRDLGEVSLFGLACGMHRGRDDLRRPGGVRRPCPAWHTETSDPGNAP